MACKNGGQTEQTAREHAWAVVRGHKLRLCRLCLEEAPALLTYNLDETAVYFSKQPETPEDKAAAERAMDVCPTLAIGNDG